MNDRACCGDSSGGEDDLQASPSATKVFGDLTTAEPSSAKAKAINDQTMAWIQSEARREAQKFAEKHRVKSAEKSLQEAETAAAASGAEVTLFKEDSEQTVGLSNQVWPLTQFVSVSLFLKNHCLEGKLMQSGNNFSLLFLPATYLSPSRDP